MAEAHAATIFDTRSGRRRRESGGELLDEAGDARALPGEEEVRRQVNWTLGVAPQDVRFPTNISEVALTANFFAALTADKIKIFVNRRSPGERANCKKKTVEFDVDHRPTGLASYDNRDVLCVVFEAKVEFYSLLTLDKVGVYQTSLGEVVACAVALQLRSPLGALWCQRDPKKPMGLGRPSTFTLWTDEVMVPQQVLLRGVLRKSEKYFGFHWTSCDTVLLVSRRDGLTTRKPLAFCSFSVAKRKVLGRASVRRSDSSFCLSPNGQHLLVAGGRQYQLLDSRQLRPARSLRLQFAPASSLCHVINDNCELAVLDTAAATVRFFGDLRLLRRLESTRSCALAKVVRFQEAGSFSLFPLGTFGVAVVFKHDGCEQGDQPQHYTSYSLVLLLDLQGRVLLRTQWSRSFVQLVTDELLVCLQYLCTKPFSAAHARIFSFDVPLSKQSYWLSDEDEAE